MKKCSVYEPPKNTTVLAYCPLGGKFFVGYYDGMRWWRTNPIRNCGAKQVCKTVTHWDYLPVQPD